jgi:hypothetical protein
MEGFGVAGLEWDDLETEALVTAALETDAFEMADLACDLAAVLAAILADPGRAVPDRAAAGFCLVAV